MIGELDRFCAINGTMQVDLIGQCASESLGSHYVSSTGGQADFMRGAAISDGGHAFIVTHATAHDLALGTVVSRIVPTLTPGAVVSTHKNLMDKVVTEHGWVSDEDMASVRAAGTSDAEIAEVVAHVAANIFSNYFNHVAGTEVDFPEVEAPSNRPACACG